MRTSLSSCLRSSSTTSLHDLPRRRPWPCRARGPRADISVATSSTFLSRSGSVSGSKSSSREAAALDRVLLDERDDVVAEELAQHAEPLRDVRPRAAAAAAPALVVDEAERLVEVAQPARRRRRRRRRRRPCRPRERRARRSSSRPRARARAASASSACRLSSVVHSRSSRSSIAFAMSSLIALSLSLSLLASTCWASRALSPILRTREQVLEQVAPLGRARAPQNARRSTGSTSRNRSAAMPLQERVERGDDRAALHQHERVHLTGSPRGTPRRAAGSTCSTAAAHDDRATAVLVELLGQVEQAREQAGARGVDPRSCRRARARVANHSDVSNRRWLTAISWSDAQRVQRRAAPPRRRRRTRPRRAAPRASNVFSASVAITSSPTPSTPARRCRS